MLIGQRNTHNSLLSDVNIIVLCAVIQIIQVAWLPLRGAIGVYTSSNKINVLSDGGAISEPPIIHYNSV